MLGLVLILIIIYYIRKTTEMIRFWHFSGVNLLQGKPVYMSSIQNPMMAASNAVDGMKPLSVHECSSTQFQANPLLSVNMEIPQPIGHVCVTNRLDGCCRKYIKRYCSDINAVDVPQTARTVVVRLLV